MSAHRGRIGPTAPSAGLLSDESPLEVRRKPGQREGDEKEHDEQPAEDLNRMLLREPRGRRAGDPLVLDLRSEEELDGPDETVCALQPV